MLLVLHGEAGGWDELAIAVVALVVMWIAVKLAGRKSAAEDDEDDDKYGATPDDPDAAVDKELKTPVPPPAASKLR